MVVSDMHRPGFFSLTHLHLLNNTIKMEIPAGMHNSRLLNYKSFRIY